jgi:hypothetical protein
MLVPSSTYREAARDIESDRMRSVTDYIAGITGLKSEAAARRIRPCPCTPLNKRFARAPTGVSKLAGVKCS